MDLTAFHQPATRQEMVIYAHLLQKSQNTPQYISLLLYSYHFGIAAYLEKEDCNFIAVDWSNMATGNYSYVGTYYVPFAGILTGGFINFLVAEGTNLDDLHLTGHR